MTDQMKKSLGELFVALAWCTMAAFMGFHNIPFFWGCIFGIWFVRAARASGGVFYGVQNLLAARRIRKKLEEM